MPPNPPARLFWSVAIYSAFDAARLDNGQRFPSINSLDDIEVDDGSVEFTFAPEPPEGRPDSKWLRTIPGEGFFIIFRLYGTGRGYYDGTWKLDDLQRMNP